MKYSDRLNQLSPYLFAQIDQKKKEAKTKGVDIIDLSIGDPDLPTPKHIISAVCEAAKDPVYHRYPPYNGTQEFRESAATYLLKSHGIKLDPGKEILTLIGSKEGIAHAQFALANPGDIILVPSPGYPAYSSTSILAGCVPYEFKAPDFDSIPSNVLAKAKMLYLNYPNNPTSAIAEGDVFRNAVAFAHKHNLILCHDAAYIDIAYDGYKAPSILEFDGAKDVAIEFHSLSKTYNMTGWRIGFAAGNSEILGALGKFKTHMDSSATGIVQRAGAVAMTSNQDCVAETCKIFQKRRDILVEGLKKIGWEIEKPKATFYVWARIPAKDKDSKKFTAEILEKTGVVITPGVGFGKYGEGFVRFSLTSPTDRIEEAVARMSKLK